MLRDPEAALVRKGHRDTLRPKARVVGGWQRVTNGRVETLWVPSGSTESSNAKPHAGPFLLGGGTQEQTQDIGTQEQTIRAGPWDLETNYWFKEPAKTITVISGNQGRTRRA